MIHRRFQHNLSTHIKESGFFRNGGRIHLLFLVGCSVFISCAFLNVFEIGGSYHSSLKLGKILFLLNYTQIAIPVVLLFSIICFKKEWDWVSVILLVLVGWTLFVGREGGVWMNEKGLYFQGGLSFFFLVRSFFLHLNDQKPEVVRVVTLIIIIAITSVCGVEAVLGELQLFDLYKVFHETYKVTGTFFNSSPFAGLLIGSLPYILILVFWSGESKWVDLLQRGGLIVVLLVVLVILVSQSRSAWVGLVVAAGFFFYRYLKLRALITTYYLNNKIKTIVFGALLLVIGFVSSYSLYHYKKNSADGRLLVWKVTSTLIAENPLFGTGFDSFQAHYASTQARYFDSGRGSQAEALLAGNVESAYNEPLQFMAELGIPGGILFLVLMLVALMAPIKEEWKAKHPSLIVLASRSSLVTIFVFGLFSYPFYSASITLLFFFSLGIVASALRGFNPYRLKYVISVVVFASLMGIGFITHGVPQKLKYAHELWLEAELNYNKQEYRAAHEYFEKALPILTNNGFFLQQYARSLYLTNKYKKAKAILEYSGKYYKDDFWYVSMGQVNEALGSFSEAIQYYQQGSYVIPHKLYPRYLLVKLYQKTGDNQNARLIAKEILNTEVKVMSLVIKKIQKEMRGILDKSMVQPEESDVTKTHLLSSNTRKEVTRQR